MVYCGLFLSILCKSARRVYWWSVVLAIVPMYFEKRNGRYLNMGGIFYILSMGMFPLLVFSARKVFFRRSVSKVTRAKGEMRDSKSEK